MPITLADLQQAQREAVSRKETATFCAQRAIDKIVNAFLDSLRTNSLYFKLGECRTQHDSKENRLESVPYIAYCARQITIIIDGAFHIDFVLRVYAAERDYIVYFNEKKIGDQAMSTDEMNNVIATILKSIIEDKTYQLV